MTERAQEFRSPQEAELARPRLDRTCTIPLAEFAALVGRCIFKESDWVLCQLEEKGTVCRQIHGKGWVAKRKDGAEGYIGKDCAHRHFGADRSFAEEASRITRELRVDALVRRLSERLVDPVFRDRLETVTERQQELREQILRLRDRWPASLLHRLHDVAKTSNRSVELQFAYPEKDDNGNTIVRWRPGVIGEIVGADVMDTRHSREVGERLNKATLALTEAVAARDQPEKTMRAWADSLDDVDRCEAELEELSAGLQSFQRPENLRLLCWTIANHADQLAVVRAALELVSGAPATEAECREARNAWREEIRTANGRRDFRIP